MPSIIKDRFNREIELTDSRWKHIVLTHPEMEYHRKVVEETISFPEILRTSIYSHEIIIAYRYYKNILKGKYIAVVMKSSDEHFVITAYITDRIKRGETIWEID